MTVTEDGFEYDGKLYRSLTKVARLRAATCDVVTLADAATVLARPGPENGPDSLWLAERTGLPWQRKHCLVTRSEGSPPARPPRPTHRRGRGQRTTFGTLGAGDRVNFEVDTIARYVARLLRKD